MLLCLVCIITGQEPPSKAVTHVQGNAVCREHVTHIGTADLMSLSHKWQELMKQFKEIKSNGQTASATSPSTSDANG